MFRRQENSILPSELKWPYFPPLEENCSSMRVPIGIKVAFTFEERLSRGLVVSNIKAMASTMSD